MTSRHREGRWARWCNLKPASAAAMYRSGFSNTAAINSIAGSREPARGREGSMCMLVPRAKRRFRLCRGGVFAVVLALAVCGAQIRGDQIVGAEHDGERSLDFGYAVAPSLQLGNEGSAVSGGRIFVRHGFSFAGSRSGPEIGLMDSARRGVISLRSGSPGFRIWFG